MGERAREMLDHLGEALGSPQLRGYRYLIAGHTDAVGSDEANLDLSYRRAQAVREYLERVHGIQRWRLAVKGWGRSRLKDPGRPDSGINRRVEVVLIVDRGPPDLRGEHAVSNGPLPPPPGPGPQGPRQWFQCPPGSHLIDPNRPNLNLDDFAAGAEKPMCRPDDDRAAPDK